jgi:LEA14-like dessication related protein
MTAFRSLRLAGAAALAGLAVGGCIATHFEAPKLSVADVQVMSGEIWQQRLKVRMHVQNPNDRPLPIKAIEYTLEVQGQAFAEGTSVEPFVVPALGENDFEMIVTTNVAGALMGVISHYGGSGEIGYRLVGKVSLSQGWLRSIPFDERGTFRLR